MKKAILYFMLGFYLISCLSEADCIITYSNDLIIDIKNNVDGTTKSVLFESVTLEGTNIVLYENVNTAKLILPVDPQADHVVVKLNFNGAQETVEFTYVNTPLLISPDCGAFSFIQNLSPGSFTISNVRIINPVLSTSATVNAEIFL